MDLCVDAARRSAEIPPGDDATASRAWRFSSRGTPVTPFSIACSTCGTRLKVRDERAIGELSLCPKCGSMVMITPPAPGGPAPGGRPRSASDSSPLVVGKPTGSDFDDVASLLADTVDDAARSDAAASDAARGGREKAPLPPPGSSGGTTEAKPAGKPNSRTAPADGQARDEQRRQAHDEGPPTLEGRDAGKQSDDRSEPPAPPPIAAPTESISSVELEPQAVRGGEASPLARAGGATGAPNAKRSTESTSATSEKKDAQPARDREKAAAAAAMAPALDNDALDAAPRAQPAAATAADSAAGAAMPPPALEPPAWTSPTQQAWRRYALMGSAVLAAMVVVGGLVGFIISSADRTPEVAEASGETPPAASADPEDAGTSEDNDEGPSNAEDSTHAGTGDEPDGAAESDSKSDVPEVESPESDEGDVPAEPKDDAADEDASGSGSPAVVPPLFAGEGEEPSDDAGAVDDELSPDTGLGELAPLIDAFPVPPPPPESGSPVEEPLSQPVPIATPTASRPRPDPVEVDVAARLADEIDGIDAGGAPLVKFLELMTQLSTIPITLDPDALAQVKARATSPVSLRLENATIEDILQAALAPFRLSYEVRGDHIVVVPAPLGTKRLLQVTHPIDDLADDAAGKEQLADHIRRLVQPQTWAAAGGEGTIAVKGTELEVRNVQQAQFDTHFLFQKLRVARGLAPRSKFDPSLFQLATRSQRTEEKLQQQVRATFHQERPLTQILNHLERAAGVTLLIDWQSLGEVGWPPHSTATLVVDGRPLSAALEKLLTPMDLAYRAIDENTLEITSLKSLTTRPEVEFYPVAGHVAGGATPETLIDDIKRQLGAGLFAEKGQYAIRYDAPAKCLLVRLPQAQQRAVEELLK